MPILHVRNVPERIYKRLQQSAETQHRSLSAEVVALLDEALDAEETHAAQANVLDRMHRHRHTFRPAEVGVPGSIELLREDRDR